MFGKPKQPVPKETDAPEKQKKRNQPVEGRPPQDQHKQAHRHHGKNDNRWTVKPSRRSRKGEPAHKHSKSMEATKHTTQEHGYAPKEGTTLRMIIDTMGGTPIHHKGDNIER